MVSSSVGKTLDPSIKPGSGVGGGNPSQSGYDPTRPDSYSYSSTQQPSGGSFLQNLPVGFSQQVNSQINQQGGPAQSYPQGFQVDNRQGRSITQPGNQQPTSPSNQQLIGNGSNRGQFSNTIQDSYSTGGNFAGTNVQGGAYTASFVYSS